MVINNIIWILLSLQILLKVKSKKIRVEEEFELILLNVEFAWLDFDVGDSYDYNYVL